MSLAAPSSQAINGAAFRVAVVAARYNQELANGLLARVLSGLRAAGVKDKNLTVARVPGSHEVPVAAALLANQTGADVVVGLGVLIGGDTNHHEMVGQSVSQALQTLALASGTPVINGVIVANTLAQARARCIGKIDRGAEFAHAALEMAALKRKFSS
jgi:6,7-dimethyl-8-ribityllumazine synthase